MKKISFLLVLLCVNYLSVAQKVAEPSSETHPAWTRPYPAFRIAANLYYVGTSDLACYLIVTPKGNILINTGLASSAPGIRSSIETLGFRFSDTKILLNTQAHYDHMGAMAAIKKLTGAKLMVSEGDAPAAADGGLSDYTSKGKVRDFQPVKADRILHDRDTVSLGGMQLVMLNHPGHTKGSCSYLFDVHDGKQKYTVLIANMPTIVTDENFSEIASYPNIARDYAYTLNAMKHLSFDIWLASHASQFGLNAKHKPGNAYNPEAFFDRKGYDQQISGLQEDFDQKMKAAR